MLIQSSKHFSIDYKFQLLRVFETLRNALDVTDRPQHRDYYTLSLTSAWVLLSPSKIERLDLLFNVLIREDTKVYPFADIKAKAVPSSQLFKTLSVGPVGNQTRAPHTVDWHFTN